MPESSFSICDLPFVPIYLLLAQFGDSIELLIYQRVNSSCLSLSRRFKAFIFGVRFWIFI